MKFRFLVAFLLVSGAVRGQDATRYPAPLQALLKQGITVQGTLPAPKGYQGYVVRYQGEAVPVYVMPDGTHAMVGTLFDATGKDLTHDALEAAAKPPVQDAATWDVLSKSTWVAEGATKPQHVVYVFTDTECPYCHKLWEAVSSRLQKNGVQVRNVMVAVVATKSEPRAAAILSSSEPAKVLREHEQSFGHSTIAPLDKVPAATARKLGANNALMQVLGINGTPGIFYKDAKGGVHKLVGLPPDDQLDAIFGPG